MGGGRMGSDDWADHVTRTASKPRSAIFTSTDLDPDMDPKNAIRESRDSPDNPNSNAIILGCDVTASMGILSEQLIRNGLGVLVNEIYERVPVTDPHIMVAGIGDAAAGDRVPLQVSQFEADMRIAEWLQKIYLEGGGGGNSFESYDHLVHFAAHNTSIDCFEKRGKKGYLFTIGDEPAPKMTERQLITDVIGDNGLQSDIPFADTIAAACKMYHYFHIMVEEGHHFQNWGANVVKSWTELIGQNAIHLSDHTKLSETIVSIIEVIEGRDKDEVADSWNGDTSLVVANAIKDLTLEEAFKGAGNVVRL